MHAPGVGLQVLAVLRVHRLHLALCGRGGEERGDEELGEAVQGAFLYWMFGVVCR